MAAFARIEELQLKFDENPRRYFAPLANELRKLGDVAQAISLCRAHLPAQPGHVSGHIVLAQALQEAGEIDEARREFETALEIDPENLIALRCIGDISRERGEIEEARAWYQRVLDADPRNAEIAQLVRDLEAQPNEARATEAPHSELPPTPIYSPAVPESSARTGTESAAATLAGETAGVSEPSPSEEKTIAAASVAEEHRAEDVVVAVPNNDPVEDKGLAEGDVVDFFSEPAKSEFSPHEPTQISEQSAMDLDATWTDAESVAGFGDLEAAPEEWFAGMDSAHKPSPEDSLGVSPAALGAHASELEDIEALFATEPVPDLATDYDSAPRSTVEAWDAAGGRSSEPTSEPHTEDAAAEILPSLSEETGAEGSAKAPSQVRPSDLEPNPTVGRTPVFSDAASSLAPAPFVTETLAELYLQQGFLEEALAIYRELLVRNPSDDALQSRVAALQSGQIPEAVTVSSPPAAPIESQKAIVSVRTFFGRLARRQRGPATSGGNLTGSAGGSVRAPVPLGARVTTDPVPGAPTSRAADAPDSEGSVSTGSGSTLTELFAAKGADVDDVRAAGSLSSAFTGGATPAGRPARVAEGELSLDHLFRGRETGEPSPVTMDEFYGTGPALAKDEGGEPEKADERTADIRQFTSWLEGLKKK